MRIMVILFCAVALVACGDVESTRDDGATPELREHRDRVLGLAVRYPSGWHAASSLTNFAEPREVLALATYPLRGDDHAGECAPSHARADMPTDGAFVWLLEYGATRSSSWADLPRERFPPRPDSFEIRANDLAESVSCFAGPGMSTTFRAADRPFQLLVSFGSVPSSERLREVEAILDSLVLEPLPPATD